LGQEIAWFSAPGLVFCRVDAAGREAQMLNGATSLERVTSCDRTTAGSEIRHI
jgi:hypothetical protein